MSAYLPAALRAAVQSGLVLPAVLMAGLLLGCGGGPLPSQTTFPPPPVSPSAQATPTAQPSPTVPAAPTPEDRLGHPTGATDVILRLERGGGLVPMGWLATQSPQFTLYGDGTFILRPATDPGRPVGAMDGLPRYVQGRMTEEYVQALLAHALGPGRLLDARDFYRHDRCADCDSTIFTIDAAGVSRTVTVEGLGLLEESDPDAADRRGLALLAETLAELDARAASGELGEITLYDPALYRVTLMEGVGQPMGEPLAWPWPDISEDDFRPTTEVGLPQAIMTRARVALLTEVPSGGHPGIWVQDASGRQWQLGVRPLLPDEVPADPPTGQ